AISTVAPATSGTAGTPRRPVTALETTEAAMPGTSRMPSAPTGWPKLSRIEGHSRPRVEPGRATDRYARQASSKAGTVKNFLGRGEGKDGSPCRDSEQHAMTGGFPRVSACGVARAPQ